MIVVELLKQLRRTRTYVACAACVVIPVIVAVGVTVSGHGAHQRNQPGIPLELRSSGVNIGLGVLDFASGLLIPILVALFAGEAVAGEARFGSLRYLLVRPIGRGRLLATKLAVAGGLAVGVVVVLPTVGVIAGSAMLGWHPVKIYESPLATYITTGPAYLVYSAWSAVGRLAVGTLYVLWSMSAVFGTAFALSAITESVTGAIAGGLGLQIVSLILDNVPGLQPIRPGLPTNYLAAWTNLFLQPVPARGLLLGVIVQVPWLVVPLVLTWRIFSRKDVVS